MPICHHQAAAGGSEAIVAAPAPAPPPAPAPDGLSRRMQLAKMALGADAADMMVRTPCPTVSFLPHTLPLRVAYYI